MSERGSPVLAINQKTVSIYWREILESCYLSTFDFGCIRTQPLSYSIIIGIWAMSSSQRENLSDIQPNPGSGSVITDTQPRV